MTATERKRAAPDVASVMSTEVIAVTPDYTVSEVAEVLNRYRIASVPVVASSEGKQVIGIISEKDCLDAVANQLFYGEHRPETARSIMKTQTISARPDQSVFDLEGMFTTHNIRHAPVVDDEGNLVGMVSRRDLLRAFERLSGQVTTEMKERKRPMVLDQKTRIEMLLQRTQ